MQSTVQSTKEKPTDTLCLHIYNGTETNRFTYYEDSGDGMEYQKAGYCKRLITFDPLNRQLLIAKQEGTYQSNYKKIQLVFHGFDESFNKININSGNEQPLLEQKKKILDGLEYMADIYDPSYYKSLRDAEKINTQKTTTIDNSSNDIMVQWK